MKYFNNYGTLEDGSSNNKYNHHNNNNITYRQYNTLPKFIIGFITTMIVFVVVLILSYNNINNNLISDSFNINNEQQPHLIVIMLDDLSWNSLYYESSNLIEYTPNIKLLKDEGITISNYYSHAMCNPSRAAFLTGKYASTLGMQDTGIEPAMFFGLNLSHTLFPQILQQNNYQTHLIGKWHLGHYQPNYLPTARGFNTFLGYLTGEEYPFTKKLVNYEYIDFIEMNETCYYFNKKNKDIYNYSTFVYNDYALDIIDNYVMNQESDPTESIINNNKLYLHLAFQAVHK
jgi:glycerol uptake facilitator-like aquaporin